MEKFVELLPYLLPVIILQLGLQIYAMVDLVKRKKVRFNNKFIWGAVIIIGEVLGPIIYFIARGDEE